VLERVEFIHRDENGALHSVTVSRDDFLLILKHAKNLNDLYDFLDRLGKWEKEGEKLK